MAPLLVLALLGSACAAPVLTLPRVTHRAVAYNTSSRVTGGRINVHLQPHSHQDAGWLCVCGVGRHWAPRVLRAANLWAPACC